MNELAQTGIEALASMIAVEVNRQSSAKHKRYGFTPTLSFREAYDLEHYRRKSMGNSENTIRLFNSSLKKFLSFLISIGKDRDVSKVTVEDIEDYLIHLRGSGICSVTINTQMTMVKQLFKTLVERDKLEKNPTRLVKRDKEIRKRKRILSLDEIKQLILSFDLRFITHFVGLTIFMVHNDLGCRVSELSSMRVENVALAKGEIKYYATKNKVEVCVPLSPITIFILKIYIKNVLKGKRKGWLFVNTSNNGKVISKEKIKDRHISRIYKEASERAGFDFTLNTHTIRRTKITQHLMNGGDLASAQELVGHQDIRSTSKYVHYSKEALRDKQSKFGIFALIRKEGE